MLQSRQSHSPLTTLFTFLSPEDILMLAPLAEREILYLLLKGEQGERLRQIAQSESKLQQINRAINWFKQNFRQRFHIEDLIREACMSQSALHMHFKAVTNMTPLQYQKQLRLQEARRLMLSEAMDAAAAGHAVGYESPVNSRRTEGQAASARQGLRPVRPG